MTDVRSMAASNQLIADLLADKERLLGEKEELIDSKEKLWRSYHDIIHEKDLEIERLRQAARDLVAENERVKNKAQELMDMQSELIEKDTAGEGDDEDDGEGSDLSGEYRSKLFNDTGLLWNVPKDHRPSETALLEGLRTNEPAMSGAAPVPTARSGISEANTNDLTRHEFHFTLLVGTIPDGRNLTVRIEQAAKDVRMSIRKTLEIIEQRHDRRKVPSHPTATLSCCAHLWATDSTSSRRWTVEYPQKNACYSCFKAGRVCLLWIGEMRWLVLPLPLQVRGDCTYRDVGFFIYSGGRNPIEYQNLWEGMKHKKKRKAAEFELS